MYSLNCIFTDYVRTFLGEEGTFINAYFRIRGGSPLGYWPAGLGTTYGLDLFKFNFRKQLSLYASFSCVLLWVLLVFSQGINLLYSYYIYYNQHLQVLTFLTSLLHVPIFSTKLWSHYLTWNLDLNIKLFYHNLTRGLEPKKTQKSSLKKSWFGFS